MKRTGIWASLILSVAAVAPALATPDNEHTETTNIVVNEDGKNIEITILGDKVVAEVDGLKLSPDHIRREGNRIVLLDKDGEPMEHVVIEVPRTITGAPGAEGDSMMFAWTQRPPVMLGILLDAPDEALRSQLGVNEHAALIEKVMDDLPASKAGLEPWDIIVEINGDPLDEPGELHSILMQSKPGDELDVVVIRHAEEQKLTITLEAYDAEALGLREVGDDREAFGGIPGEQPGSADIRRKIEESMRNLFGGENGFQGRGMWRFDDRGRLVRPDDSGNDWREDMIEEFEQRLEDLEDEFNDRLEQLEDRWDDMEDMFDRLLNRLDQAINDREDDD
ncbi:MAG TPA: PDZ domain-containing protein [Phycisphaerales bacterium]|nr:PDZ domain-containing protein [Phycisphaerales bacterium]